MQVTDLDAAAHRRRAAGAARSQPLGSTTKLLTAAAALRRLGPDDGRSAPSALVTAPVDGNGVLAGDLDPARRRRPGARRRASSPRSPPGSRTLREITGSVVGDETLFDALRTGPSGNGAFDAELGGPLSALAYERGAQAPGGPPQADPARAAAARFDDVLEARGVVIRGVPRAGATPPGALPIAAAGVAAGAPTLVGDMLTVSDDWTAEMLTKGLAAKVAPPPATTAAGARDRARRGGEARRARLARRRLRPGPARPRHGRRASSRCCAGCARRRRSPPRSPARAAPARCAAGSRRAARGARCRGKTGTLPSGGVSVLAGYCNGRNGHAYAFAVLVQGRDTSKARRAQDRVARALAAAR